MAAVVVNINTALAGPEIRYILNDACVQVVFTDSAIQHHLTAALKSESGEAVPLAHVISHVILIDVEHKGPSMSMSQTSDLATVAQCQDYEDCFSSQSNNESALPSRHSGALALDDDFHMYYTSGTTGHPKGVLLSHRIVVYHAIGTIEEMKLNKMDVWAHLAPMFHLVDVFAIYAITLVGGRHVTIPTFGASEALMLLERECITVANLASTMIAIMVENPVIDQLDFSSLRLLSCGGSPQSPAVIARAISVFGCEFFISYGMTECCGKISMSLIQPEDLSRKSNEELFDLICTSGRPFCLIDVRIVGDDNFDVPKDDFTSGEVWVRGPTVFRGYCKSPEATSEAFADNGWFRTGDLAVAREDGYIRVIDRKKDMLLVGGENVYTTEVEEVLHAHPDVLQAAVFGVPNPVLGELVSAAVVLRQGTKDIHDVDIIRWCRKNLAEYKVPASVHILDTMPTTSTGKPLKTELRKLFASPHKLHEVPLNGDITLQNSKDIARLLSQWCFEGDSGEDPLELSENFGTQKVPGHSVVIPGMTYVLVMDAVKDAQKGIEMLIDHGIRHIAIIALFPLISKVQVEAIAAHRFDESEIIFIHINAEAFSANNNQIIRAALGPIRSIMPPIARVVYPAQKVRRDLMSMESSPSYKDVVLDVLQTIAGSDTAKSASEGQPLMASGVSSTLAVQLVSALEDALGMQLPGTLVFDYPTVPDLVEFLTASKEMHAQGSQVDKNNVDHHRDIKNVLQVVLLNLEHLMGSQTNNQQSFTAESPLMSEGLTSTMAVQLASSLESVLHIQLPPTLVFDYPTPQAIAEYIVGQGGMASGPKLTDTERLVNPSHDALVEVNRSQSSVVAIVASDHELPGRTSRSYEVVPECDRITLVPLERWDVDADPSDSQREVNLQFGSFLNDVAVFDANLFGIAPAEALLMDPQQRRVMESFTVAAAGFAEFDRRGISDSGTDYVRDRILPRATSIFVGISQLDYARIAYDTGSALNTYYATGAHLSVTAGRLAYTYGLQGAAVVVDTACSSSLVTTHFAARSVRGNECEVAGSLGVNLTLVHSWTRACLRAGMLSDEGRCKTMDASADGYVRAEAVGSVLLSAIKKLPSAEGYGPRAAEHAKPIILLLGTAVNEDGRSSSLTAPNGPAQQEVIHNALQDGRIGVSDVSLIEMHGTGTSLGDPIETGALVSSFLKSVKAFRQPLTLSTAKSLIGHAEPGAGIAGIVYLANSLENQCSKPFVHLRSLNAYIATALNMSNPSRGATSSLPRLFSPLQSLNGLPCGGVSSFAFQGTNAHAVFKADILKPLTCAIEKTKITVSVKEMLKSSGHRYWVLPPAHALASRVSMSVRQSRKDISFSCNMHTSRLTDFWEQCSGEAGFVVLPSFALESVFGALKSSINDTELYPVGLSESCFDTLRFPFGSLVLSSSLQVASRQFMVSVGTGSMHEPHRRVATGCFARLESIDDLSRRQASHMETKHKNLTAAKLIGQWRCKCNDKLAIGRVQKQDKDFSNGFLLSPSCFETQSQLTTVLELNRATDVNLGIVATSMAAMSINKASYDWHESDLYTNTFAGEFGSLNNEHDFFAFWDGMQYKPWKETLEIPLAPRTRMQQQNIRAKTNPNLSTHSLEEADLFTEVSKIIEKVLGFPTRSNQPLMEAGLDSLGAVELATILNQRFGVTVHSTLVFDFPTAEAVSKHLLNELKMVSSDSFEQPTSDYLHTLNIFHQDNYLEPANAIKILNHNASPMIGDEYASIQSMSPFCGQLDRIKNIPLDRWDADLAGLLDGDETLIPIHVSSQLCWQMMYHSWFVSIYLVHSYWRASTIACFAVWCSPERYRSF